jgi:hypothetical protein
MEARLADKVVVGSGLGSSVLARLRFGGLATKATAGQALAPTARSERSERSGQARPKARARSERGEVKGDSTRTE